MNVYSGTNSFSEFKEVFKSLLSGKDIVKGSDLAVYEELLKSSFKSDAIYTFASGRMGFYTILRSMGIEKDDEIIIPSYTCVVVPNAILYSGAKPIYCDVSRFDFNIDITKIEELITDKTKAIYAQHTFGQMCDINEIKKIADRYNLPVIEDVALSLGAKDGDKYAGTIGDFGYFSTDRTKIINTSLGGIVSINNPKYIDKFNSEYKDIPYLSRSFTKKLARTFLIDLVMMHPYLYWLGRFTNPLFRKLGIVKYFLDERKHNKDEIVEYPYPAKFSNILAKIGISQIESLDKNLQHRREVAHYYNSIFGIYTDEYIDNSRNVHIRYSFLINNREYWEKRFSSKIDLSIWFKTVAVGKDDKFEEINYTVGSNRESEFIAKHIFNLPTHNNISPKRIENLLYELKNSGDIISPLSKQR
jgi:dTDP-4-amino-4,6-dideoxygalactose transaminase